VLRKKLRDDAYAGALMRADTTFSVGDLREALAESVRTQIY
jgi:hypothetical protein